MAASYESRLQDATLAIGGALGATPMDTVKLEEAFQGLEAVYGAGVKERRISPLESLSQLSDFAGRVITAATASQQPDIADSFANRQHGFQKAAELFGITPDAAPTPPQPSSTRSRRMDDRKS